MPRFHVRHALEGKQMRQKTVFMLIAMMLSGLLSHAETESGTLLSIDGNPVSAAEFSDYYRQAACREKVSPESYLNRFLYFKLKVADARKQRWDTLPEFRLMCSALQGKALEHARSGSGSRGASEHRPLGEWVNIEHISCFLPQHAPAGEWLKARRTIDSVYQALRKGASFHEMSAKHKAGSEGYPGEGWMPLSGLLDEFSERLGRLGCGEFSEPFVSPLGVHIVRLVDRKTEEAVPETVPSSGGKMSGCSGAPRPDEASVLSERIEEGLLAVYWDGRHFSKRRGPVSDKTLELFFKARRKSYAWDLPHFKGGVVHCLNKKAASTLKKKLKKLPLASWKEELERLARKDGNLRAEAETGLFQIGRNEYVDKLAFKCGGFAPKPGLPYTFVVGKRLKKGPEDFEDVRELVERDYAEACEEEELKRLQKRFSVEINQEVLKTVNCDGSE